MFQNLRTFEVQYEKPFLNWITLGSLGWLYLGNQNELRTSSTHHSKMAKGVVLPNSLGRHFNKH